MINLHDIRYVRLGTRDLEGAARYATSILGLEEAGRSKGCRYFRSDSRDHTLVYCNGDPAEHCVGFELADGAELDAVAAEIEAHGLPVRHGTGEECELRRVERFVHFTDPSGNAIDLVVGPQSSHHAFAASRDAGRPVRWTPTLGHDPRGHEAALAVAVEAGRLSFEHARDLAPALPAPSPKVLQLVARLA